MCLYWIQRSRFLHSSVYLFHSIVNSILLLTILVGNYRASKRPVGILHVKVLRAMKLKKKDLLGGSDPYVKLKLTEDKLPSKKTTVKHKNLNPEWNEEFKLVVKDPQSQALELHVYDWEQVYYTEIAGKWYFLFLCCCV